MSDTAKTLAVKILAIIGFSVTVVLIIWLAISIASRIPNLFNSLANIADSINLRKEITSITVELEKTVVNAGEAFTLSWTDTRTTGMYRLGYTCVPGIALRFEDPQGNMRPLRCEEPLPLPHTVTELTLVASSSVDRFSDIVLTVQFAENDEVEPLEGTAKLTIVNAQIPVGAQASSTPAERTVAAPATTPTDVEETPRANPAPQVPQRTVTTIVYPQSDPNGFTDLEVSIVSVGTMRNGVYIASGRGSENYDAVQFRVKNIGTKTSSEWSFRGDIPGDSGYRSPSYAGLKPKEYMIFTMGFGTHTERSATFTVQVREDTTTANNEARADLR
jgi:hypothetical protein